MKIYEIDESLIEKGLHQLFRKEANIVIESAKESAERAGSAADKFMDVMEFAKRYIDTKEYENIISEAWDKRYGEIKNA